MEIIFFLLPVTLLLAIFFLISFFWMAKSGQYDDLETPCRRILFDDQKKQIINVQNNENSNKEKV